MTMHDLHNQFVAASRAITDAGHDAALRIEAERLAMTRRDAALAHRLAELETAQVDEIDRHAQAMADLRAAQDAAVRDHLAEAGQAQGRLVQLEALLTPAPKVFQLREASSS